MDPHHRQQQGPARQHRQDGVLVRGGAGVNLAPLRDRNPRAPPPDGARAAASRRSPRSTAASASSSRSRSSRRSPSPTSSATAPRRRSSSSRWWRSSRARPRTPGSGRAPLEGPPVDAADEPPPRTARARGLSRAGAALAVLALWAGYGVFFSRLSIIEPPRAQHAHDRPRLLRQHLLPVDPRPPARRARSSRPATTARRTSIRILVLLSPLYLALPAGRAPPRPPVRVARRRRRAGLPHRARTAREPPRGRRARGDVRDLPGAARRQHVRVPLADAGRRRSRSWLLYFLETEAWQALLALALVVALLVPRGRRHPDVLRRRLRHPRAAAAQGPGSAGSPSSRASVYFAIVKRFFMTSADIFMSGQGLVLVRVLLRRPHPQPQRRGAASWSRS